MGDDWEDDDWEAKADDFKPALVPAAAIATAGKEYETKGQAVLAGITEPDMAKFADEDEGGPVEKVHEVVKSQPKKKEEKEWMKREIAEEDTPLDDPVAEKERRQRLVEQADFAAAQDLFAGVNTTGININTFLPKSVKDFEELATALAERYILPHKDSKNYKILAKAIAKKACEPLSAADTKDVESNVGVVRAEKLKAEAAAKVKAGAKKFLNTGGKGGLGGLSAGLDDYQYADAGDGDDDFM